MIRSIFDHEVAVKVLLDESVESDEKYVSDYRTTLHYAVVATLDCVSCFLRTKSL
jgi:hypothetical protein